MASYETNTLKQDYEEFGKKDVAKMDAAAVKELLLASGMFAFIKQRPYDVIADPTIAPKAIFVSSFDSNPLAPEFEFALKGEEANFQAGLDALAKIAKTYLSISVNQKAAALTQAKNVTVTVFDGPHPAGNVGVQINHISPINKGETVWTIDAQAVIFIGRLLNTGRVDLTRMVAVTGSEVKKPAYCKLKVGACLTNVFAGNVNKEKELRLILYHKQAPLHAFEINDLQSSCQRWHSLPVQPVSEFLPSWKQYKLAFIHTDVKKVQ